MQSVHTNTQVKDMTSGNISSLMLGFALPIFLSQVFQQLYNTADAFIVGRHLGTNALAAVTSSGTLIFLLISFFMGGQKWGPPQSRFSGFVGKRRNVPSGGKRSGKGNF